MDVRGGAARRKAGLGMFDLIAIISVIAILGVSLGGLLASRDAQFSNEARRWMQIVRQQVTAFDLLGRAESAPAPNVVIVNH